MYCVWQVVKTPTIISKNPVLNSPLQWVITYLNYLISFNPCCITTGPQPLPKSVLHTVRSSASSFNLQYPILAQGHSVAAYHFYFVFPSLLPSIVPSKTYFRKQFLCKMWATQFFFLLFTVRILIYLPNRSFRNLHKYCKLPNQLLSKNFILNH